MAKKTSGKKCPESNIHLVAFRNTSLHPLVSFSYHKNFPGTECSMEFEWEFLFCNVHVLYLSHHASMDVHGSQLEHHGWDTWPPFRCLSLRENDLKPQERLKNSRNLRRKKTGPIRGKLWVSCLILPKVVKTCQNRYWWDWPCRNFDHPVSTKG